MERKIEFRNGKGLKLRGVISIPKKSNNWGIVYCHGFPSSIKGKGGKRIGKSFSKLGYTVLKFNFSHTPDSEGKFEDKLMSKEVEDIKSAIDFLSSIYRFNKFILIGHSTGAIDASLYAYRDKRITHLVLSGPVSDLKHAARYDFTDEQMRDFYLKGYIVYNRPKSWVHKKRLKKAFYDEFFTLDIPRAMKKFNKPLLIIHGEKDEAIPSSKDPIELYKLSNNSKKLAIIKGADHSFTSDRHWKAYISKIHSFIKSQPIR